MTALTRSPGCFPVSRCRRRPRLHRLAVLQEAVEADEAVQVEAGAAGRPGLHRPERRLAGPQVAPPAVVVVVAELPLRQEPHRQRELHPQVEVVVEEVGVAAVEQRRHRLLRFHSWIFV